MVVDTHLLKHVAGRWYDAQSSQMNGFAAEQWGWLARRVGTIDPAQAADVQVAFYGAAQNLSRLSYQAIIAVTFVIFPLVSRVTFAADIDTARVYIRSTLRYSLLFSAVIAGILASNAADVFALVFPQAFVDAGRFALVPLALGYLAFALLVIAGTILNGAGKTKWAVVTAVATLTVSIVGNLLVTSWFSPGPRLLAAVASATAGAMGVGTVIALWILRREFSVCLSWTLWVKLLFALSLMGLVGGLWHTNGTMVLFECFVLGGLFVCALVVTREISRSDLVRLTSPLRRKSS